MTIEEIERQMRSRETTYSRQIPAGLWIILRLDGHGFSSLTERHFQKPFDQTFHRLMLQTAGVCLQAFEAVFATTGSDEISLLLPPHYQQFNRRSEKILSLAAGLASSIFTRQSQQLGSFDCRIQATPFLEEVANYYHWRQADIQRNSIATQSYWTLRQAGMTAAQTTARLRRTSWEDKERMLTEFGVQYKALPGWQREGMALRWERVEKQGYDPIRQVQVSAVRRRLQEIPVAQALAELPGYLAS